MKKLLLILFLFGLSFVSFSQTNTIRFTEIKQKVNGQEFGNWKDINILGEIDTGNRKIIVYSNPMLIFYNGHLRTIKNEKGVLFFGDAVDNHDRSLRIELYFDLRTSECFFSLIYEYHTFVMKYDAIN